MAEMTEKVKVDRTVIERAVYEYSDMVVRVSMLAVKNKFDAEDIMQSVFLQLIKQREFDSKAHLKAWLIRVAINMSKDFLKSAYKKKTVPFEESDHSFEEKDNDLFNAVGQLGSEDQAIIFMFYYEGYSAKEIGYFLGKRESAIHTRLSRARKQLKNIL